MACGSERISLANTVTQKVCAQRYGNIRVLVSSFKPLCCAQLHCTFIYTNVSLRTTNIYFDIPNSDRIGNDAWGLSPTHVISYKLI